MPTESRCLIWGTPVTQSSGEDYGRLKKINSPRAGGRYEITETATIHLGGLDNDGKLKLTTWIVDQNRYGDGPEKILSGTIDQIKSRRKFSVLERRHRLIEFLRKRLVNIGQDVAIGGNVTEAFTRDKHSLLAWTESLEDPEVRFLIDSCEQEGLIEKTRKGVGVRLTTKAY